MFGRMSGQKSVYSSAIRQESSVCYLKNKPVFVRHEPDIREKTSQAPRYLRATAPFFLA